MREMKDSGIEWVGKVPKIWSLKPIRALFDEVTEKNFLGTCSNALKFTYGSIVRKPNFDADADDYVASTILNYTVVEPGTIMLNGLNLNFDFVSQRIGLVKEKGVITSAYMAFKPNEKHLIDSEFANYLFKAYDGCKAFHNMGGGVRKILNFNEFKKYYIPLPDLNEQQHIVDLLDTKCSEIDATAEDIQKEISLLEDYKKSVITEAVTKGLNPDAEMKDSGIEWIGEIPKHWKVLRIKNVGEYRNGLTYKPTDLTDENTGTLVLRSSNIQDGKISLKDNVYVSTFVRSDLKVKKGDILICSRNGSRELVGKNAIIEDLKDVTFGAFMMIFRCDSPKYLYYILNSKVFSYYLGSFFTSTINQLTGSNFGNMKIVYVSDKLEQSKIVSYLDDKCSEIDTLIADKKRQLDILADYKKSLIYEYVTGKKEVPVNE